MPRHICVTRHFLYICIGINNRIIPLYMDSSQNKTFTCLWTGTRLQIYFVLVFGVFYAGTMIWLAFRTHVWILYCLGGGMVALLCVLLWLFRQSVIKSRYVVTTDGYLEARYYGRKTVRYPIAEIEWVRIIDDDNRHSALPRYFTYPVSFGRGGDIVPETGVLVSFNRQWYKSVCPVLFHPIDSEGLMQALLTCNPSIKTM